VYVSLRLAEGQRLGSIDGIVVQYESGGQAYVTEVWGPFTLCAVGVTREECDAYEAAGMAGAPA
jgi:hypothetical protein